MENGQLLNDIWEKVSSIDTRVAVIDEKVTATQESVSDHEGRLRSVEKKVWYVAGAGAAIAWLAQKFWR